MKIKKISFPTSEDFYNKSIFNIKIDRVEFQFGTVFLKKGTRIPEKGYTRHDRHEISIIQKGKIEMLNKDNAAIGFLKTGDVIYIDALEAQAGNVIEDTELIYTLIK